MAPKGRHPALDTRWIPFLIHRNRGSHLEASLGFVRFQGYQQDLAQLQLGSVSLG